MNLETKVATFTAWLDARAAVQERRLRFTRSQPNRTLLKNDIAERETIADEFRRIMGAALPQKPAD